MKKLLSAIVLGILVWGCAKKITPANSATGSNAPATTQMPVDYNTGAGTQPPVENSATFGTKVAPKEKSAEETTILTGQNIYNAKCGRCHALKVTTDFTAERWAGILAVMAPKANLTDAEKENVYAYVKANAKK